jgi:hypothetical protein
MGKNMTATLTADAAAIFNRIAFPQDRRHDRAEAGFEAEASDQSRWCAGTGRCWTGAFADGKRIRIHPSDRGIRNL